MPGTIPPPNFRFNGADREILADASHKQFRNQLRVLDQRALTLNGFLSRGLDAEDFSRYQSEIDKLGDLRRQIENGDAKLDGPEKKALAEQIAQVERAIPFNRGDAWPRPTLKDQLFALPGAFAELWQGSDDK